MNKHFVPTKPCQVSSSVNKCSDFLDVGWDRGPVWACSKFKGGNKDNVKINSVIVRKRFVFHKMGLSNGVYS